MAAVRVKQWYRSVRRNLPRQQKLSWRWLIVRILDDAIGRAGRFDIATDSRALSFTFILSLVPLLAIAFTFFKLFGGLQYFLENTLKPLLQKNFPADVSTQLNSFIDSFVGNLQTGTLGVVSFVTLLATVIALMMNIEQSFNRIFEARDRRSLFKRIGSYWIMLSATPLFIVLSTAKSSELMAAFKSSAGVLNEYGIVDFLRFIVGHIVQIVGFGALFIILPERKPRLFAALWGAIITHLVFQFLAAINVQYATFVFSNRTNLHLYGSLPLLVLVFLIWVRLVWVGILFGACLCASVNNYLEELSTINAQKPWHAPHDTILNCIRTLELYIDAFNNQRNPPTQAEAASTLELSIEELELHQDRLQRMGLLLPIRFEERDCFNATASALHCHENPHQLVADMLGIPASSFLDEEINASEKIEPPNLVRQARKILLGLRTLPEHPPAS